MPLFHLTEDEIVPVRTESFAALRVTERGHLQRLLRSRIDVIAPGCMVIAEEFGEWDHGSRRIDLLALDSSARLVVIELKRTEDAGHAELQAIRYASMVSTMTFDQAVEVHSRYLESNAIEGDARQRILGFLGWSEPELEDWVPDVRIVLVSANFGKELTTAVLWLRDRKIDITCVRLVPYALDGKIILDVQPVIPLPETAEYQVRVRERDEVRREAATNPDRNQKYDVIAGDVVERKLYKRQAIHRLVRALADRGVSPEQMMAAVPSYKAYLFVTAPGHLSGEDFVEAARAECERVGRAFDHRRFFIRDDELIHTGGRTYAVSNQFGTNTELVLTQLSTAFPFPDVRWSRSTED